MFRFVINFIDDSGQCIFQHQKICIVVCSLNFFFVIIEVIVTKLDIFDIFGLRNKKK